MNDEAKGVATWLQETSEAPESAQAMPDREEPRLRPEDLPGRDLSGWDLTKFEGLLPEHLAGAKLTGAKLPDDVAKFGALGQVKEISAEARKIFIGLLAACVYSWLVIGTTTDVALILNTASSPLPIINTPIPIANFYVVGAALLAAVYCYFHFYLQRLWRTLATLPAVFPDGVALDDKTDPWLLTNLARSEFALLRANAPPLSRLENLLTIILAWWVVPATLLALWVRYLPAHYIGGLVWLAFLIAATTFFGVHTFGLARATLRRQTPSASKEQTSDHPQPLMLRIWRDARHLRPEQVLFAFVFPCVLFTAMSFSVVLPSPRNTPFAGARFLNDIGIRTYADLREVEVAQRPEGRDGQDWTKVKRVDLRERNLAFTDATRAFLANADLRGANLVGANLDSAQLQGVDLRGAQLQDAYLWEAQLHSANMQSAQLENATLSRAQLQGAALSFARLEGAGLTGAKLQGADLRSAFLQGAVLRGAQLQAADLSQAWLQGAILEDAELQGAYLGYSDLKGADLWGAQLQGADLSDAQIQGADLRRAGLWRALAGDQWELWSLADLRGTDVDPMADPEIDALLAGLTAGIADEDRSKATAERITAALRSSDRPTRPEFPEEWLLTPNVMFEPSDPEPEPLDWGHREWDTVETYDERLATFLGDLACRHEVPTEQSLGLARRALGSSHLAPTQGGVLVRKSNRLWPGLLAARLLDPDCPPAKGLSEDMRRDLEELAASREATAGAPETFQPDVVE